MVVPGILVPAFSRLFVDYYLVKRFDDWLQPLLIGMLAAALLQACLTWLQQRYLLRFETRFSVTSSSAFIRRLVRLPISFFGQRSPSELAVRATHTESPTQLAAGSMGTALLSLPAIVIFGAVMVTLDLYLGLLAVTFALINLGALTVLAGTLAERNQAVMIQQSKIVGAAASGLRMIADYKASGSENLLFQRIVGLKARQENLNASLQPLRLGLQAVPMAITGIATAALLTVGGTRVISGDISVGVLVAFQALLISFLGPVNQLVGMGQQVENAKAYVTQIDDLMRQPLSGELEKAAEGKSERGAKRSVGEIVLRDVAFGGEAFGQRRGRRVIALEQALGRPTLPLARRVACGDCDDAGLILHVEVDRRHAGLGGGQYRLVGLELRLGCQAPCLDRGVVALRNDALDAGGHGMQSAVQGGQHAVALLVIQHGAQGADHQDIHHDDERDDLRAQAIKRHVNRPTNQARFLGNVHMQLGSDPSSPAGIVDVVRARYLQDGIGAISGGAISRIGRRRPPPPG